MSTPRPPQSAKLVIGCLLQQKSLFAPVVRKLTERFGPLDVISSWMAFEFTRYYEREMGRPLFRRVVAFREHVEQEQLPEIKLLTNGLEDHFSEGARRRVNLDPGYMLPERFVLATGKNYTHRIYVGKGIYADLTLIYTRGAFQTLPWTYPDYAQPEIQEFLFQVRSKYLLDLKGKTDALQPAE